MFGPSQKEKQAAAEKEVIRLLITGYADRLMQMSMEGKQAVETAAGFVNEMLVGLGKQGGNPFGVQGDNAVKSQQLMEPRLAAGLAVEDVRDYWNSPIIERLCEVKMFEATQMFLVELKHPGPVNASNQTAVLATLREFQCKVPRYGDPKQWNATTVYNQGLKEADADIYPEFAKRVDAWVNKTPKEEVARLVTQHGTLNAAIRQLVAAKQI